MRSFPSLPYVLNPHSFVQMDDTRCSRAAVPSCRLRCSCAPDHTDQISICTLFTAHTQVPIISALVAMIALQSCIQISYIDSGKCVRCPHACVSLACSGNRLLTNSMQSAHWLLTKIPSSLCTVRTHFHLFGAMSTPSSILPTCTLDYLQTPIQRRRHAD